VRGLIGSEKKFQPMKSAVCFQEDTTNITITGDTKGGLYYWTND